MRASKKNLIDINGIEKSLTVRSRRRRRTRASILCAPCCLFLTMALVSVRCRSIVEAFPPLRMCKPQQSVSISPFHRSNGSRMTLFLQTRDDDDEEEEEEEEEEECSIDNLDACLAENNLEACIVNYEDDANLSLPRFMSMPIIEVQLAVLTMLSSLLVGLGTLQSNPPIVASITSYGELVISAIFTLEYLIRWQLNDFSAKYLVQPLAIIDLVAILPGLIKVVAMLGFAVPPSLLGGALINLRLLRILRLQRVLSDYETFSKFEQALGLNPSDTRPYQLQLARVVISITTLLSVTSGLIYSVEHKVNPEIPDYFTALYFGLTTLTTVGFGDIHPVTTAGRWIVSGSILIGSAVVPAQAAALVEALLDREGEKDSKKASEGTDGGSDEKQTSRTGLESISARMDRLETKVDQTNARIDKLLESLEAKQR